MSAFFQNTYNFNMPIGIAGRIADCGFKNTLSPVCIETIPPAVGVMKPTNSDYRIMLPRDQVGSATFSTNMVLNNVLSITVNGTAVVSIPFFPGEEIEWYQDLAAKIEAIPTVSEFIPNEYAYAGVNPGFQVISTPPTVTTLTAGSFAGGASQPTVTLSNAATGTFFGVTQFIYNRMNLWTPDTGPNAVVSSGAPVPYYEGDVAPTLTQGRIYVVPETLVYSNSPVYLRIRPNGAFTQQGAFRGDADSATCVLIPATQAIWREGNGVVGGLAVLELNLP